jgi:CMP-N,N'-diacetyllegionaminic acid synthase
MVKKVLIIGTGSVSLKHKSALTLISKKFVIVSVASRKFSNRYLSEKKKDFDYIVICSPSTYHLQHLQIIEKNFINKKVLIEKPIFNKFYSFRKKLKNSYFVGYNLRFHPLIRYLKNFLIKKKIYSVYAISHSFLPDWRRIDYKKSVSAKKKLGGGVLLELSHELDYLKWIFKDIEIFNVFNKKISNLKIDVDDILNISGMLSKKIYFNLNINFFSRLPSRKIKIDGNNFSLNVDLINNSVETFHGGKKLLKRFSNVKLINTYKDQHLEIIKNKIFNICSFREGLDLVQLIEKIKNYA